MPDEPTFDPNAKPIWQEFDEILSSLPREALDRLPTDGARNHDRYIYEEEFGSLSGWRTKLLQPGEVNIGREVDYIVARAAERAGCIVQFAELVLFSTKDGDAWLFDTDDRLALCMARAGVRQDFKVFDSPERFSIEWTADYRVEGAEVVVKKRSGGVETVRGFPRQSLALLRRGSSERGA